MLRHENLDIWEDKLKTVFDKIDDFLENKYGKLFELHPRRLQVGTSSNKEDDGLFNVGASYSLGLGSKYGAGYVIEVHIATLEYVKNELKEEIDTAVADELNKALPAEFPGRDLKAVRDGNVYKIIGDFNLGEL